MIKIEPKVFSSISLKESGKMPNKNLRKKEILDLKTAQYFCEHLWPFDEREQKSFFFKNNLDNKFLVLLWNAFSF